MNIKRSAVGAFLLLVVMWVGVFLDADLRVIVACGFAAAVLAVFSTQE